MNEIRISADSDEYGENPLIFRFTQGPALTVEFQSNQQKCQPTAVEASKKGMEKAKKKAASAIDFDYQNLLVVKKRGRKKIEIKETLDFQDRPEYIKVIKEPQPTPLSVRSFVPCSKKKKGALNGIDKTNIIKDSVSRSAALAKKRGQLRRIEKSKQLRAAAPQVVKRNRVAPKKDNLNAVYCDVCDKIFKSNLAFGLHSKKHNVEGKYACHMCTLVTTNKYRFTTHVKLHEGDTPFKCATCDKPFINSVDAAEHVNFHTGDRPFICEICGKTFMYSRFLSSHRRYQHWEIITGTPFVKYDCTVCNIHYTSSSALRRHNANKHKIGQPQPLLCDVCGKELSSKEKLKFHSRIHTGYKPHGCAYCPKAFTRKEQLKEHVRVHTGEKPYICRFCQKGFSQRTPLRVHERIHTGERPYICSICTKGFTSKGAMDSHMKSCSAKSKPNTD